MEFARYLVAGALTYALDFSVFLILTDLAGTAPVYANVVAKLAGGVFSFFSHRMFTFGIRESAGSRRQAVRYFAALAVNVPLFAAVFVAVHAVLRHDLATKVVSDILCIAIAYLEMKFMVFRKGAGRRA